MTLLGELLFAKLVKYVELDGKWVTGGVADGS